MLWVDTYRPQSLSDLDVHPEVTETLSSLAKFQNIPHLLFYGNSGSGRSTRAYALIYEMFGPAIHKTTSSTIKTTDTEYRVRQSHHHIHINASDFGVKDLACMQQLIKELATLIPATAFAVQTSAKPVPPYRMFVISDADYLSVAAQASLRATLEKTVDNARVVMICENLYGIIGPLRSRCLCIRIPSPSDPDILKILKNIAKQQKLSVNDDYMRQITQMSGGNIRRAVLTLESAVMKKLPQDMNKLKLPWMLAVEDCAKTISQNPTPAGMLTCREHYYNMMVGLIPANIVIREILKCLVKIFQNQNSIKLGIAREASYYSSILSSGTTDIYHLEAFTAAAMSAVAKNSKR